MTGVPMASWAARNVLKSATLPNLSRYDIASKTFAEINTDKSCSYGFSAPAKWVGKLVLDGTENWKYDGAIFWITAPNAKHCIPAGTHFAGAENPYELPPAGPAPR